VVEATYERLEAHDTAKCALDADKSEEHGNSESELIDHPDVDDMDEDDIAKNLEDTKSETLTEVESRKVVTFLSEFASYHSDNPTDRSHVGSDSYIVVIIIHGRRE
jgi:hypothetical protein